jgi:hypothetical protein
MGGSDMKQAMIRFEHDLEDGWYRMKEPDGPDDTWEKCVNAYNFAKSKGWEVIWVGDPYYKPKNLKFDEPRFGGE